MDALAAPKSRLLDAGCGQGRVGAELARRGHAVTGVDADPVLIEAARADYPGSDWLIADLTELSLRTQFDGIVLAGNVMPYLAEDTHELALARLRAHTVDGGFMVIGFGVDRGYELEQFDRDAANANWRIDFRFATWDLKPWNQDADFAVTLLRPAQILVTT